MAQSKAGSKEFWPAKLLEFCPAYNPRLKEREQYRVLFLDGLERVIRRSWFYTSNDDEFFQCTVGLFLPWVHPFTFGLLMRTIGMVDGPVR